MSSGHAGRLGHCDIGLKILFPKHLIHQRPHPVDILVSDLHEARAALGQQFPRHHQTVAQVRQVGMDAVAPGVAEGFHLLGLAGQMLQFAVLHVARGGGPLEVRVELDAIRRVDINRLHLALQPFAL